LAELNLQLKGVPLKGDFTELKEGSTKRKRKKEKEGGVEESSGSTSFTSKFFKFKFK